MGRKDSIPSVYIPGNYKIHMKSSFLLYFVRNLLYNKHKEKEEGITDKKHLPFFDNMSIRGKNAHRGG